MGYLIMTSPPGRPAELFDAILADLQQTGWRLAVSAFGLAGLTRGRTPPDVVAIKDALKTDGIMVGRVFDRRADDQARARRADLGHLCDPEPLEAFRILSDHAFGDYLCVLAKRRDATAIYRAPSGGIDAFTWRRQEVILIADEVPEGLAAPDDLSIDWDVLGEVLTDPVRAVELLPLRGLSALDPGVCRHGARLSEETRIWTPARVVRRGDLRPSADDLRAAVDLAVSAEVEGARRSLCEISGGLDSAIVAASLTAIGRPADLAVNFWRDQAEADERRYAQAAADLAGVPLKTFHRALLRIDAATFDLSARSVRPSLAAADPEYDRLMISAIQAAKADVLITGHGGDAVFYQLGAADIAADLLAGAPCQGARLARLADIARRTRRSVWSLAREVMAGRPSALSPQATPDESDFLRAPALRTRHPWVAEASGLHRAKRTQITGLVSGLVVSAHTRRASATRLGHPLLSQPVVELCLRTPIPILSSGEGERTFAREAFGDRLPPLIANRRSKGDITTYFGRSMAASSPYLRLALLDGRLVAEGLLDRAKLEAALTPEALIWRNTYRNLFLAAGLEAWIGYWEGRGAGAASGSGPSDAARKASARA